MKTNMMRALVLAALSYTLTACVAGSMVGGGFRQPMMNPQMNASMIPGDVNNVIPGMNAGSGWGGNTVYTTAPASAGRWEHENTALSRETHPAIAAQAQNVVLVSPTGDDATGGATAPSGGLGGQAVGSHDEAQDRAIRAITGRQVRDGRRIEQLERRAQHRR